VSEPPSPKSDLEARGLHAKRHFGQNFLADRGLADKIAELAAHERASVLELGAGMGALTAPLLERAGHVIAVERDRDLVPVLKERFAEHVERGVLDVLEADAQQVDVRALLSPLPGPRVLCGNLPYQISGPLIQLAVAAAPALDRVVFLLQLEVVARLAATPDSDDYGALSVFTQAAFDVSRAFVVRRGAFYPQPGVDSAVVRFTPKREPTAETPSFRALVRAAFGQRRKKLRSAWRGVLELPPPALAAAAERANIDLDRRGETLSVADFARMANEVLR
jgi:16S rRNA (adenine1518-N6/adenine1519-N6)-dimethyltransferase